MKIYKAQPLSPDKPLPDLLIEARKELIDTLPGYEGEGWEKQHRDFYKAQAREILSRILASLPGGTIDALLVELLDHKRSLLIVPHKSSESKP